MTLSAPTPVEAELASRIVSRRSLLPFVQRMNSQYQAGWVHEDICRRLEKFSDDVAAKKSPRLMLLMPPRSGKSELCSRSFPSWHMGRNPDHEIIACSYNVSLAMTFSKKVKEVLEDPSFHPVFDVRLDPNDKSAEEWSLQSSRGAYVAAGVGGGITGKGAHLLIIDDPLKNAEEADSADIREKLWDWYGSTAYTRLAPGGGVLVVQCMVGDTPVLMADGVERRLDSLVVGDRIATYANGALSRSLVKGLKSNGRDSVLKITTTSGKMVRCNGRHPFLATIDGDLKWIRARSLTTAHKIVALPDSGGSGEGSLAQKKGAWNLPNVGASVPRTTTSKNGQTGPDLQASTPHHAVKPTSSTGTGSPPKSTTASPCSKAECAPSAENPREPTQPFRTTGRASSLSTIATTPGRSAACSAMGATPGSDILELSPWHSPQLSTSDFTLDEIVSVEPDGEEEVFDVQVASTENFIANGLVSHNTWWHDDDLAGRLQNAMAADSEADQFTVVRYPAISESDEYLDTDTDLIVYEPPQNGKLLRLKGEALHPERYNLKQLEQIKRTISPRFWSALYQQNPVPDDGAYFLKEHFRRGQIPVTSRANVYIAWDFAISEKKQNDYTVGTVGLQDDNDMLHVAEMVRFKSGNAFFIVEAILNLCSRWYSPSLVLGFEDGQIWRSIESLLKKRMRERKMYLSITVLKPITDKLARARALQGRMQQGMVSFNASAEWYDAARLEMLRFPAGAHDDQVDSLSWMTQLAVGREPPQKPKTKEPSSWRDKLNGLAAGTVSHMAA